MNDRKTAKTIYTQNRYRNHPEISISLTELKEAINSCKSTAAPGPD